MSKYWSANFLASDLRPLGSVHRHLSLHEVESTNKEKEAFRAFLKWEELDRHLSWKRKKKEEIIWWRFSKQKNHT